MDRNKEYALCPAQNTLKDFYSKCDAWLFGSRSQGFGVPILEAMACRTPVIGNPTGAASELLSEGAGMLVEPEEPSDMARAIPEMDATGLFEAALHTAVYRSSRGDFLNSDSLTKEIKRTI